MTYKSCEISSRFSNRKAIHIHSPRNYGKQTRLHHSATVLSYL